MGAMAEVWRWIRRADPMGATIKGVIILVLGIVSFVAGRVWLGLLFSVLGATLVVIPLWLDRRDRERSRRWRTSRRP